MTDPWRKLGLVWAPAGEAPGMQTHAALPSGLEVAPGRWRIYVASRDAEQRSHVAWFEVDLERPDRVLDACRAPVLGPGPLGHFDSDGTYAASVVRDGALVLLYYIGWNRGAPPMFYPSIGLAVSEDGGRSFVGQGRAPIMGRSEHDPWMVSAPFVLHDEGRWRMWYLSGQGWDSLEPPRSRYHVKHAWSADGRSWTRDGTRCFGGEDPAETNVSRACVLRDGDRYLAWVAAEHGAGYRTWTAISADGLGWTRRPNLAGPAPSAAGWDAESVEYPFVIRHHDRLVMFYNGNRFGRDGVGVAVADASAFAP